ncbi:gamma-interferon-inducible lysosomal thiol reductase-like protein [Choristoneura fumiferana]|uniref:gamma-interferon-inducible lysosomal thiol reductase-like protein n=1 Tax=Choristoneura fumiferana TaxID=7141 RepID=UPI003D15563D
MTTCSDFTKMAFSCTRYRLIVVILLSLIMWQLFSMFPGDSAKRSTKLAQEGIVELEDDKFNIHKQDKVKVRVYYEALCPDSKHFFMRHLWPVTEKLSEFLEIALIPYGKATTKEENGQYYFQCQHGETECYANKIHACSIETIGNMTMSVEFTECMISDNNDPDEALSRCAKSMNVDPEPISTCANNNLGSALLMKYGADTHIINPYFIPTVTLNGSKPKQTLPAILKNFLLEVCKRIAMPLPPPCL